MNASEHLAQELDKALNGGAWHGPSLREALEGVDLAAAVQRPIPEAHSIAELVHHTTTWQDVVRRRLGGETPQVSEAENWPPAPPADEAAWQGALRRLFDSGRELHAVVRAFPLDRLHEKRPGIEDTWYAMISGELQHLTYHAGQVVILRKSARAHAA
jgi:DinB superfamily